MADHPKLTVQDVAVRWEQRFTALNPNCPLTVFVGTLFVQVGVEYQRGPLHCEKTIRIFYARFPLLRRYRLVWALTRAAGRLAATVGAQSLRLPLCHKVLRPTGSVRGTVCQAEVFREAVR
ncbi:hypothetical protein [Kutzneria albida]|uniref:Uncharacterized protein n=1 Tax=Kutzneria albida DSM 43870 TaxID=1449976 RepID=W5W005_9PSEU|nr:hypothetical protein [Kutzneria albida]AHH94523.1 hypothetical protein KALB_1150 [Kutzneria albida DSM 43870]